MPWWRYLGYIVYIRRRISDTLVIKRAGPGVSGRPAILQFPDATCRQILQALQRTE